MKKFKILTSFVLSIFLLTSCQNKKVEPVTPTDEDQKTTEIEGLGKIETGGFTYEKKVLTSTEPVSSLSLKDNFENGTFIFSMKKQDQFSDNGALLKINDTKSPTSYYFVGIDILNKVVFSKVTEEKTTFIYKEKVDYDLTASYTTFGVYFKDSLIQFYLNDHLLTTYEDDSVLKGSNVLLKANGANTSYKDITIDKDRDTYLEDLSYYFDAAGYFEKKDENFISQETNSLLINDAINFTNGSIEVTMSLNGEAKDNGIVFGVEDDDSGTYWEGDGIKYYFFFTSLSGLAYLGKANNGKWVVCGTKDIPEFNPAGTYKLKIIRQDATIYCFVDDILYIAYTDNVPCKGTKFGLRSGASNIVYTDLKVNHTFKDIKNTDDFEIGSGNLESFQGVIKTTSPSTIATIKDKAIYNGTLETTFVPGGTSQTGIIFRATTPSSSYFENEEGLSYYFLYVENGVVSFTKVNNGTILKETKRFFPYGTSTSYQAKILLNEGDIYCYLNNRLVMHYVDEEPLNGQKIGIRSGNSKFVCTPFKISELQEKQTNEYLIFGHSYTDFWKTYKEDFYKYKDIYNIGIGGAITSDWGENGFQNEVIAYEPKFGIYWNGINDINRGINASTIGKNVREMAIGIHNSLPNFRLVLISVCRCPIDSASDKRAAITSTNNFYKSIANDLDYVTYIDTELMYCDSNGNEIASYFTDGLHPTHEAYKMCANLIMDTIK